MDVILMESVDNLGEMGETVTVARGYARNYLIPQGKAVLATEGHRKMVEQHMKLEAKRDDLRPGRRRGTGCPRSVNSPAP